MSPSPRIALVSLARHGGFVHYLAELANAFSTQTETSVLAPLAINPDYFSSSVRLFTIDTGQNIKDALIRSFNPLFYLRLYRLLRAMPADIFHVAGSHEWNPILAFIIKRLLHKPLFYTIHDTPHHPGAPWHIHPPDKLFRRSPAGFIVHTQQAKSYLISQGYPEERLLSAYTGPFNLFNRRKQPRVQQEDLILFFGRIEPYKGLNTLLKAVPDILAALPSWKLAIAGSGPLYSQITPVPQHDRLIIHNRFLHVDEVTELMQRAKFVVMPYNSFTYSGVLLTAYSFDLPIVSTLVGAIPELIPHEHTGLLVPPQGPAAFTQAVIRLAQDEALRQQLSANIPSFVQQNLNWVSLVKKCLHFYHQVLQVDNLYEEGK